MILNDEKKGFFFFLFFFPFLIDKCLNETELFLPCCKYQERVLRGVLGLCAGGRERPQGPGVTRTSAECNPALPGRKRCRGWERSSGVEKAGSCGSRVFLLIRNTPRVSLQWE